MNFINLHYFENKFASLCCRFRVSIIY